MKKCNKCLIEKPLLDFGKDKYRKDGFVQQCKNCRRQYQNQKYIDNKNKISELNKIYREKNKEKIQEYHIMRNYGITLFEKQQMILNQNNKCKICKNEFKNSKDTHIDHDHGTRKVRGLLCSGCNRMLGFINDNINTLQNAISYLRNKGEITIELDDYEVANLIHALKFIPENGEWLINLRNQIETKVSELSKLNYNGFKTDIMPNSGIDIPSMKKHIEYMAYRQKYPISNIQVKNDVSSIEPVN